ncbi:hypothetical protein Barb6_00306 [Bacteroidales bacterium Barb6]|nr:hypothetical protein Barb6_00306 [Bacteroidales bacterium Barb6]
MLRAPAYFETICAYKLFVSLYGMLRLPAGCTNCVLPMLLCSARSEKATMLRA